MIGNGYIPITPQDANPNNQLAANLQFSSIEKPQNRMAIPAVFLNQKTATSCNLIVNSSHLGV